ncbi:MAG: F0F1 ATP synthase subunit delta [Proteobacteria bacterium]|nr:F0F1 ATP synthase subunit delta [Pseudomonadota bacterium]MDA1132878.1 F0F1 ATP synthase subunit delta [Pseudomonadota bacterium]
MTAEASIVSGLAGRYAVALFDLALQRGEGDAVQADLEQIAEMMAMSADLSRLVHSPQIGPADQGRALAAVLAKAGITGIAANFVGVVTGNRRLFLLPQMIRQYRALLSQHKGEVDAEVTSATELNDSQIAALKAQLAKAVGRDVRLSARVDPEVLGGLVVRVGSRMIDSSLRTKLNNLQHTLKEVA